MSQYLDPEQLGLAAYLWEQKKWDTLRIADHLNVCESVVYRSLAERRDERFCMRAIVKRMAG